MNNNYTTTFGNTYELWYDGEYSTSANWELSFDTLQQVIDYCEEIDKANHYTDMMIQLGAVGMDWQGDIIDLRDRLPEVTYIYLPNKATITACAEWMSALVNCYKVGKRPICLDDYHNSLLLKYEEHTDSYQELDSGISAVIHSLLSK